MQRCAISGGTLQTRKKRPRRQTVVNLSEVFGEPDDTAKFVSRYLRATHADLFFADGAILVEGAAERILVPHFIEHHFKRLHSCYVTLLEVGGSHAQRLKPLIEHLGLNTLIITDIDAVDSSTDRAVRPQKGCNFATANNVLKAWHPEKVLLDELLELKEEMKEKHYDDCFSIRVAYQTPLQVALKETDTPSVVYPRTFEDALALQNIEFFRTVEGLGFVKKIRHATEINSDVRKLHEDLLAALESGDKAKFALDVLYLKEPELIKVPEYINEGLKWLEERLQERRQEVRVTQSKGAMASEEGAK